MHFQPLSRQVQPGARRGGPSASQARWQRLAWRLLAVTALLCLLVPLVAAGWACWQGQRLRQRVVTVDTQVPPTRYDTAALARGRYLFDTRGCATCHGPDGQGRNFLDDPARGWRLAGPDISPGPGSSAARYTPADWARLLRHGLKPDGRPVLFMPSEAYAHLSDDDTAALITFLAQLPPGAGRPALLDMPLSEQLRYGLGEWQDAAARIDHQRPLPGAVPEALTPDYGRYLAQACMSCHGATQAGGWPPGPGGATPQASALKPGAQGPMAAYANALAFRRMMRTGQRPDGSDISRAMPFDGLSRMTDLELDALYLYLRGKPAANAPALAFSGASAAP